MNTWIDWGRRVLVQQCRSISPPEKKNNNEPLVSSSSWAVYIFYINCYMCICIVRNRAMCSSCHGQDCGCATLVSQVALFRPCNRQARSLCFARYGRLNICNIYRGRAWRGEREREYYIVYRENDESREKPTNAVRMKRARKGERMAERMVERTGI